MVYRYIIKAYLIFLFLWITYGSSLELSLINDQIQVGEKFTLKIEWIDFDNIDTITILWIESFHIIGQKIENTTRIVQNIQQSHHILTLDLEAPSIWDFIIWPASIKQWNQTFTSKSVSIKVIESIQNVQNKLHWLQQISKKKYIIKHIYILIIWFFGIGIILRLRQRYKKQYIIKYYQSKTKEIYERPSIPLGKINWFEKIPKSDDPLFIEQCDRLLRDYLQHHWGKNIYNLTYQEILQLNSYQSWPLRHNMESLRHAFILLQKWKYAKLSIDHELLIVQIRNLFKN